jgi:hypothetical protein
MKKESLGSNVIDGIQVEGERLTVTTPAGVVGNDQPSPSPGSVSSGVRRS